MTAATRTLPALLAAVVLAGCAESTAVLAPAAEETAAIEGLWWIFLTVSVVVFIVVIGLLLYGALVAGPPDEGREGEDERRRTRAVAAGVLVTALVLLGLLTVNLITTRGRVPPEEADLTVEVVGHQYWWEVRYLDAEGGVRATTANEVHLPQGLTTTIRVRTADVIHSFWIPSLAGKIDMIPGRTNTIVIRPTETGTFDGQCAEFCGRQHALMALRAVVEPPARFRDWLRRQAEPAPAPTDSLARQGLAVFMSSQCHQCHTVRGTSTSEQPGPDLSHLATRQTLAAGTLPNTRGSLTAWLADPQFIKPGNLMPTIPLDADELRALTAYLGTLD